ncbi:hypothetical protein GCM10023093_17440 [Nemorincola caseinilytica]|uniref:EGF-like domain-containing protein n=1 Tax=Nemorincola caseinilytica TaxID=2054315 RepID=A0ABP8ND61_9BACT
MRPIKNILFGVLVALSVSFVAFYSTSCSKDQCGAVTCQNKGVCFQGVCNCIYLGTGGPNCEHVYRDMFSGLYEGHAPIDTVGDSTHALFFRPSDDTLNREYMVVFWQDTLRQSLVKLPIKLYNYSTSGSNFKVVDSDNMNVIDYYAYSGTGTISVNTVSMRLVSVDTDGVKRVFEFNNYIKK